MRDAPGSDRKVGPRFCVLGGDARVGAGKLMLIAAGLIWAVTAGRMPWQTPGAEAS
ncbi:hypothetical protein APY04_2473 [Hyphomicrobium sulfonivorans]|uniref:Uncharacterized protein n=1 Tax=Hyphomicrobium sulfonivorans TaxID=121290 RepID=A0A109BCT9_HYPSL|nr:hypothetical protein APY04_2473 [Hyphomicrobium sulfonivorans]